MKSHTLPYYWTSQLLNDRFQSRLFDQFQRRLNKRHIHLMWALAVPAFSARKCWILVLRYFTPNLYLKARLSRAATLKHKYHFLLPTCDISLDLCFTHKTKGNYLDLLVITNQTGQTPLRTDPQPTSSSTLSKKKNKKINACDM